jgi:dihydroorotate dehydrogenase
MSDPTRQPADNRSRLQCTIERLLEQFQRFGLSIHVPEYIATDDGPPASFVADSRARLLKLLSDDHLSVLGSLGESELEGLLLEFIRLCIEGRLHQYLAEAQIPYPIYNFFAGFQANSAGPWDLTRARPGSGTPVAWELMGLPVRYPLGVPASGLTANARWVGYFARRGFNVLTYKTVRSRRTDPHRYPHWVFIEDSDPWQSWDDVGPVHGDLTTWPKDLARFSTANSFGVPSAHPDEWRPDVESALANLGDGQLLIVSVMGCADDEEGVDQISDFVHVALLAEATGARVVELNLSCPNTARQTGPGMDRPVCEDPDAAAQIVGAVRAGLRYSTTRLVAKLSYLQPEVLEAVVSAIGHEVDGIAGINTVQVPITSNSTGRTPFIGTAVDLDRERDQAGVSGTRILDLGLDFVRRLVALRAGHRFDILGMGGVTTVDDVFAYQEAGATAVQTATGACLHPELPAEVAGRLSLSDCRPDEVPRPEASEGHRSSALGKLGRALSTGGLSLIFERDAASSSC